MTLTWKQRAAYGPDWPTITRDIRVRAEERCECTGECDWGPHMLHVNNADRLTERCPAMNGYPSPLTGSVVVLTVAHLDHNGHEGVHDPDRLKAMCQGCHLSYDRNHRTEETHP